MADKVPVKATYDSAGDADGLSEYVSGDTLGYAHGGTGLSSLGSAGQLLRVNSSANAIEWGAAEVLNIDGMTDGSSITIADTDKFGISDGGTEKYVLASQIKTYVGPLSLIDEDDMSSNSATRPPSQQSVKAYVDGQTHLTLIDEDNMSTNSATRPPSQQSVKSYVDNLTALEGGDLTIYEDANNADVSLKLGTSAAEALSIEVLNGASNKTAEEIKIKTSTASGTANHGKISIYIDDVEIMDIDDGGIDMASGKSVAINGTDLPTSSGKILQVVTGTTTTDTGVTATTSYTDTGLSASITPASSSNKIMVMVSQTMQVTRDGGGEMVGRINIMRATTELGEWYYVAPEDGKRGPLQTAIIYVDSPSSTSALTYKTQMKGSTTENSGSVRANQQAASGESTSSIHLIEIEG